MVIGFVWGLGFGFVWLGLVVWCFSSPFLPNRFYLLFAKFILRAYDNSTKTFNEFLWVDINIQE